MLSFIVRTICNRSVLTIATNVKVILIKLNIFSEVVYPRNVTLELMIK